MVDDNAHDGLYPSNDPELRRATSEQQLWALAERRSQDGDEQAIEIAAVCARIHASTVEEATRLSNRSANLSITFDADPSGQLHLVHTRANSAADAKEFTQIAASDGYIPWQSPESGAEELFFRTTNQLTMVQMGDVAHTIVLHWPEGRLTKLIPDALTPTARDWSSITLPRFAWPAYFGIRPIRLVRERLTGAKASPLPLGPILSIPIDLIAQLLEFAELSGDDHLVDLGCGDGRILVHAVRSFGCRATGVEQDERLVELAQVRVDEAALGDRVAVVQGDANTFDLSETTVVFLFIPAESVADVAAQIRSRGFSGRIISHEQLFVSAETMPMQSTILVGAESLTVAHRW